MAPRRSRRRGGWRRKGAKLQAYVRVHDGEGGFRTRIYDLGTSPREMQGWIDDEYNTYRRKHPKGVRGTLAGDVPTYLKLLVDRPRTQQQRGHQLAWWCERFGNRPRATLHAVELETALNELTASGKSPSTVKKYRTALYHLFTKLDGKNEPNPLRDVPPPREPDPLPRAIPYAVINALFAEMPNRRYATKLDADQAAAIYREAIAPRANRSAIARAHGLSETMVRKIVAKHGRRFDHASQTKARLQVMAYVGLPPAQIRALRPEDINLDEPSVLVRGRKKGGGTRTQRLPLLPVGVAALRSFIAAEAFQEDLPDGRRTAFSMSVVLYSWRRAIKRMCDKLEADPATEEVGRGLRSTLAKARPYDLRHSFLTEAQLATGNINATQGLALHADSRMTRRYTLAAVAPELQRAADLLAARWGGQRTGNELTNGTTETPRKASKPPSTKRARHTSGKRMK